MKRIGWAIVLLLSFAATMSADTVTTGYLTFGANPANLFDPIYGFVPAGFANSVSYINVPISPVAEFGAGDLNGFLTATFSIGIEPDGGTQLAITDSCSLAGCDQKNFEMRFTNPGYTSLVQLGNDTFPNMGGFIPNGGISSSLDANFITVSWAGGGLPAGESLVVFDLGLPSAVPEPSTLILLATGLMAIPAKRRILLCDRHRRS
jgi:hypothetical protein